LTGEKILCGIVEKEAKRGTQTGEGRVSRIEVGVIEVFQGREKGRGRDCSGGGRLIFLTHRRGKTHERESSISVSLTGEGRHLRSKKGKRRMKEKGK